MDIAKGNRFVTIGIRGLGDRQALRDSTYRKLVRIFPLAFESETQRP